MFNWLKSLFRKPDNTGCIGNTIRVHSGCYVDTINPTAGSIHIEDIAHGLANLCRFNGQTSEHYSVAEHSIHCLHMAMENNESPEVCFAVLMHDSSESILGDITRPLKRNLRRYRAIEKNMERVIGQRFGFDLIKNHGACKFYDNCLVFYEKRHVFAVPEFEVWPSESMYPSPSPLFPLMSLSRREIEEEFLYAFDALKNQDSEGLELYRLNVAEWFNGPVFPNLPCLVGVSDE